LAQGLAQTFPGTVGEKSFAIFALS